MTTNYDPIAEQYKRSKEQPWRTCIECYTLLELLGDLRGKSVLDVACGEGFYSRIMRARGAARVTGVDLSPGMIELARRQEARQPLGIEYRVGDARELSAADQADVVAAAYLLNYAQTRAELAAMCGGVARALQSGGRFVTVNSNPALRFPNAPSYRKYGFETSAPGEWREGAPIKWTFHLSDGAFDIENYYLTPATHEEVLREAGFRDIRWHAPRLSPAGLTEHEQSFWAAFLAHPPVTFLECVR